MVKNPCANEGDAGLTLGLGGSPRRGNANIFQYFYPDNPMDRKAKLPYSDGHPALPLALSLRKVKKEGNRGEG